MKIVKYIFLLLLLVAIAVSVFVATQEGKFDISRERVVKVPENVLYNYINDYNNWENVKIFAGNDASFSLSEGSSGQGATADWKGKGDNGSIQTVKTVENDSIFQKAIINNQHSDIVWGFKDTIGGTKVTIHMTGELSFTDKAYSLIQGGVENKYESVLDKSLENINTFLTQELSLFKIGVKGLVTKTGTYYLQQSATAKIPDIGQRTSIMIPKILGFIKENKIVANGAPFVIYKTWDTQNNTASFSVCVPIKEEIFTAPGSEFSGGKLDSFLALKTTLEGDYSHLRKAWDAAHAYIKEKSLPENPEGRYIEMYTKGMEQTKKPSKWITDIYIPIRQKAPPIQKDTVPARPIVPKPKPKPVTAGTTPQ